MTPTTIIGLIVGLFALLAIVGTIIVYLRGTVADGTIASLERSNAAFQTELAAQKLQFTNELAAKDRTIADGNLRITALELKSTEQDRTIEILKGVVTNADEVKAIHVLLGEHHGATTEQLAKIEGAIEKVIIREGDRHGDASDV